MPRHVLLEGALSAPFAHTGAVQTPEPMPHSPVPEQPAPRPAARPVIPGYWGERLAWVSGLVLAISAFTDWYAGSQADGLTLSVTGWHTGALGKLVFFIGLAVLLVVLLREIGVELPAAAPESLVTIALGAVATILVLIRLVRIPEDFFFAARGVGLWISLVAAIGVIAAGLLQISEEL